MTAIPRGGRIGEMQIALVAGIFIVGVAGTQGPLVGAMAVLAVACGLVVLQVPAVGAVVVVGVVPVLSGLKRGFPVPGMRLSEIVVVGIAAIVLLRAPRASWSRWQLLDWLALAYAVATLGFGLIASASGGVQLGFEDFGQLLGPLQFFLIYRTAVVGLRDPIWRRRAIETALLASIPMSLVAFLQAAQIPSVVDLLVTITGVSFEDRAGWSVPRVSALFPHWTVLAAYEFAIVVLASSLLLNDRDSYRMAVVIPALGTACVALILALTIGSIIGALCAVLILAAWSDRLLRVSATVVVIAFVAGVLFAPLLTQRADEQFPSTATASTESSSLLPRSVSNRVTIWTDQYLPALRGHYLIGYGPRLPPSVEWKFTESIYIAMAVRGGLALLAVYLALIWTAIVFARRRGSSPDPGERLAARFVFAMLVVMAVTQLTAPLFILSGPAHLLWGMLGLLASYRADRA